jgi:hypothetical protein
MKELLDMSAREVSWESHLEDQPPQEFLGAVPKKPGWQITKREILAQGLRYLAAAVQDSHPVYGLTHASYARLIFEVLAYEGDYCPRLLRRAGELQEMWTHRILEKFPLAVMGGPYAESWWCRWREILQRANPSARIPAKLGSLIPAGWKPHRPLEEELTAVDFILGHLNSSPGVGGGGGAWPRTGFAYPVRGYLTRPHGFAATPRTRVIPA